MTITGPEEPERTYSEEELKDLLAMDVQANLMPLPSFTYVVKTYQAELYRHARGIVILHESAEDVLQVVFFNAHQALKTYTPDLIRTMYLRAWLYKITHNEALKCRKKNKLRQDKETLLDTLEPHDLDKLMLTLGAHEEVLTEQIELRECLTSVFKQLTENEQASILWHFVDGLEYKEIGKIVHLAEGSIKSTISRARQKLRDLLSKHCPEYFNG